MKKNLLLLTCFVLGTVLAAVASAERFLPAEKEAQLREAVPNLADDALANRINDESQTYFYTSKRFWARDYSYGGYRYRLYLGGRGRRGRNYVDQIRGGFSGTSFQHLSEEITDVQWKNAGGLAAEPGVQEIKFISLPKVDGKVVPIVAKGVSVVYPNGTLFGGILCRGDLSNPVEFRLREKVAGEWKSTICRLEGKKFAATNLSTKACNTCHADAGTFVNSEHGWSGVIGADRNFSFGEWAANVQPVGNLFPAQFSQSMIDSGLLEFYNPETHTTETYGL